MDQTGKFMIKSSKCNQRFLILYVYDTNTILFQPIKNRMEGEINKS